MSRKTTGMLVKVCIVATALFVSVCPLCPAHAQDAQSPCAPDGQIMLLQDYQTFDLTGRGWRAVDQQPGCEAAAADLIARYRALQRGILQEPEARTLRWHEGQVRAGLGDTAAALALLTTTHDPDPASVWNPFVDATIAFLNKDRPALEAARDTLAAAPQPPEFEAMAADFEQRTGRRPVWPPNLDVVRAFVTCFDRTYREAYVDPACRA